MRVGVTGSSGFIGTELRMHLEDRDIEVISIDRQEGIDILSAKLYDAMEYCDTIVHLAGILGTAELFGDVSRAIDVNIKGTLRVLEGCRTFGIRYVGITMPSVWNNVYQATKISARILASAWHESYGVAVSHVRAFNVFGQGQKTGKPQKIIPTFSSMAWRDEPIPIWGDGSQLVDLVHVRDVAAILTEALNFEDDEIIDAGTAHAMTVNEVAQHVLTITQSQAGVEHLPMRLGERGPGVICQKEGWSLLTWHPEFRLDDLYHTVLAYRA